VNLYEFREKRPQWDLVEWPEPIVVEESRDEAEVDRVRKEWERRIQDVPRGT